MGFNKNNLIHMKKLVLFDIDKTLIKSSKCHSMAFSEGFKRVYGVDTAIDIIDHQGMTDQQIIIEVLGKNGLDEKSIKSKLKECMKVMVEYFKKNVENDEIVILEGVRELLEQLNKYGVLMGLVTGNLKPIARGKLEKIGINHYFKVGGFGSDGINRTNLVKIAIRRAEENFDFIGNKNVFLIGDNPREIKAGLEAGVKTIGVATGNYSMEELGDSDADFVLSHLGDTKGL